MIHLLKAGKSTAQWPNTTRNTKTRRRDSDPVLERTQYDAAAQIGVDVKSQRDVEAAHEFGKRMRASSFHRISDCPLQHAKYDSDSAGRLALLFITIGDKGMSFTSS